MPCNDLVAKVTAQVRDIIINAVNAATQKGELPETEVPNFTVEIPADTTHGDFAANIAMSGAKAWKMAPPKIAQVIVNNMNFADSYLTGAEIAGPGFLNFTLSQSWFSDVVATVNRLASDYGRSNYGRGEKINVEFVSANPTGPMHLGNARGGVTGDCLASIMEYAGYEVTREFYLNDAGNQIEKFGLSLEARYIQHFKGENAAQVPEGGYEGVDITEHAVAFAEEFGDSYLEKSEGERKKALIDYALPKNIEVMRTTLERYRVKYDIWFSESILHQGNIDAVVKILDEKGLIYEKDDAVWYKATDFGGEKDEVLIRGNGNPTYYAADIAYHYNKFAVRGFSKAINLWGADHHGHVSRLKGAMDAIGLSGDNLDIVLFQMVRFLKDGEPYRMSKRSGNSITLNDLLDMVSVDAARFFFNMREIGSTMDFDLDLAVEESSKNPVFYVQYAHARICSIIKKLADEGKSPREVSSLDLGKLVEASEVELIRTLAQLPTLIVNLAEKRETAGITHYASALATSFHKFYTNCYVNVEDESLLQARLALCIATKNTLANTLELMKISAPESM